MARIQCNVYKAPYTTNTRYGHYKYSWRILVAILPFCFILQYTFSFWLWHWRCCGRHHIDDRPHRSSLLIHTGIQARIWTRLDTFHSTDEVMLHQARFILKSLVIKKNSLSTELIFIHYLFQFLDTIRKRNNNKLVPISLI